MNSKGQSGTFFIVAFFVLILVFIHLGNLDSIEREANDVCESKNSVLFEFDYPKVDWPWEYFRAKPENVVCADINSLKKVN